MQNELEDMLKRMTAEVASESGSVSASNAGPRHASASPSGASPGGGHADASFQQTIRRTMERMQASGDQATAAAASSDDDFMTEILKNLSAGSLDGEGGEEELSKVLMGMMEQLTNKEILYEPMKELNDKFPDWLEKHKDSLPQEELMKYQLQRELVREMVSKFEESTYSDDNAADREYILDRMQKVRACVFLQADQVSSKGQKINAPHRCKRPGRRQRTWWETWPRRRMSSTRRMTNATLSRSWSAALTDVHHHTLPDANSLKCTRAKHHYPLSRSYMLGLSVHNRQRSSAS